MTTEVMSQGQVPVPQYHVLPQKTEDFDDFDGPKSYTHHAIPWYKDVKTICMLAYIITTLIVGSTALISLVFTQNPWEIFGISFGFTAVTFLLIFIKIRFF